MEAAGDPDWMRAPARSQRASVSKRRAEGVVDMPTEHTAEATNAPYTNATITRPTRQAKRSQAFSEDGAGVFVP